MTPLQPRAETLDVLRQLIRFDTTSRNSNLPLIDWAEAYLTARGARCQRVPDPGGQPKATLWATFGPEGVPGVVLSGHSDTVPVDGQDWSWPPHELTEDQGRLYGRGTSDMKGFLACCMALADDFAARPLAVPLHLAFSYDEEVGCLAVRPLLDFLASENIRPRAVIVGEPTMMDVAIGHKSKRNLRVTIKGTPGHSGRAPEFVNAIEYGARLIVFIQDLGRRLATETRDPLYDVPVTTAHVGVASGGQALNIVPEDFSFLFEFRALASHDPDALIAEVTAYAQDVLLPQMNAVDPRAAITFEQLADSPGVDLSPDHDLAKAVQRYAQRNSFTKIIYGTEGGIFQQSGGLPTVICGPGSIDVAHQPDEYITPDQLALCEAFLLRLLADCRSGTLSF